jgi:hypothetical protein
VVVVTSGGILPPFLAQSFMYTKIKADEERAVRGSFVVVGLCFCTSHLAARCPAHVARSPKRAATQTAPGRAAVGPRRGFASVLVGPPQNYGHRLKLAEGTLPRGLTYHCTDKARHI